ncbi:MAG: c-type cytochrome [Deltaproteobacteria bacterium]|nr:c-type cytochrome [Deltaproteobacteria bacterium]
MRILKAALALALFSSPALAEDRPLVGDAINGKKLYGKECAECHGADARGGRTAVSLSAAGRMNILHDAAMFAMLTRGAGLPESSKKAHALESKLGFLDVWDVIAHIRSQHMNMSDFFPKAGRYIAKDYTIDANGIDRLTKLLGAKPDYAEKSISVFTFFNFDGEEGNLRFIPQDPIELDQLKKTNKAGYLVFGPLKAEGFDGELGIAMDVTGKITRALVHPSAPGADLLNKSLSRFEGMGKFNLAEPFKVAGGGSVASLSDAMYKAYQRAMEAATMYVRDERERTWADSD